MSLHFYPRPPRGGRRRNTVSSPTRPVFLSTPSARRATIRAVAHQPCDEISIHALREEGDFQLFNAIQQGFYFYPRPPRGGRPPGRMCVNQASMISIHALREEGDVLSVAVSITAGLFLSTPSARRATHFEEVTQHDCANFYPRPPRGGRRQQPYKISCPQGFLSTPSARRATGTQVIGTCLGMIFLSTPSARRATV